MCVCVCVCVSTHTHIYIYIYIYITHHSKSPVPYIWKVPLMKKIHIIFINY